MKKYGLQIKYLAVILSIVFLYGFASKRNAQKRVMDIDVVFENGDNLFISYETVNKLLIQSLGKLENQSKENINLNSLEDFVQGNEMVEKAEVFLRLDGGLGALITQRTPVLRVANNSGSYYYDTQGSKMPLSGNYSARVPIATNELNDANCKEMICLANRIRNDDFLRKQIIGINQIEGKDTNQFELVTRLGNQIIIFGELKNLEEKISKLKVFYQKSISDKTLNNYKSINLKFKNQVVCAKY